MIEADLGTCKIAIEGKITRNVASYRILDQLYAQLDMILELTIYAGVFLTKSAPFKWDNGLQRHTHSWR
jgi:hypothetical protein